MSDPFADRPFPRGALLGAAALVALTIALAATSRWSGFGTTQLPESAAVTVRDLRFDDRADGAVVVHDAHTGELVEVVQPGTNGFLRGALRGLARERRARGIGSEPPFRLAAGADGRLTLEDPSTGRRIALEAFGPTNAGAFARLLAEGASVPARRIQ
ncbi:MAG TPA: photosynthetic complex assembly protein PuhC [Burkholderiales bacterium]|nr:photosynthetic complex assembly protein PuhC [Burkholderiales bacterium]